MTADRPLFSSAVGAFAAGLLALLASCSGSSVDPPDDEDPADPASTLAVELVAEGIPSPVHLTSPPGDGRLFVVEQRGRIRILLGGEVQETPFLDIRGLVSSGGERGLLSLAFHPEYETTGWFYVNYTDTDGHTRVVRYSASADPQIADPESAQLVLLVEQPFSNHNGGQLQFGPDGMLYIGMGDGGSGGDPQGHGQDLSTLLGALLRIDVNAAAPYDIPADNPFTADPDARDEIWAFGLRNPWRFSFDEADGMLWVADVGQNRWEEVNAVPTGEPGINYGWNVMEGEECFGSGSCDSGGLTLPVLTYPIGADGCAVVGGHVYRGSTIPDLAGHYVYSDWCAGWLRSFRLEGGSATDETEWDIGDLGRILSIGEDSDGEIYLLSSGGGGRVYRLIPDQ